MQVIDFRFANQNDEYDCKFLQVGAWSRIYEYFYVIDFLKNHICEPVLIHNTSWGFEGVHITFRNELDKYGVCTHSDITVPNIMNTLYYDIQTEKIDFENKFDFVINISAIEHLKDRRLSAIQNLFKQVKIGGYLVLTFDYPRVDLAEIQEFVGVECGRSPNPLNGENSVNQNLNYSGLNIVYLVLRK